MRNLSPLITKEIFLQAKREYLSTSEELKRIRVAIHTETLSHYPDGFTEDTALETDEEAYLRILEETEAKYPLHEAGNAFSKAQETFLETFLCLMEAEGGERGRTACIQIRAGLFLVSVRAKVLRMATEYR